jgi:serine/threonine protein kinase
VKDDTISFAPLFHRVIYRDLKPENIGFDVRGNAKIFDFGLAKELQPKDRIAKDQYKASGRTGTRRYMAPEVTLCKPYGKPADAYSFAILSWGTLALETPYDGYSYEKHAKHVVQGRKRPMIPNKWPTMIKELLTGGWHSDPSARNDFDQMCGLLGGELENESYSVMDRSNKLMDTSFSGFRVGSNTGVLGDGGDDE